MDFRFRISTVKVHQIRYVVCHAMTDAPIINPLDQLWLPKAVPSDYLWHFRWSNRTIDGTIVATIGPP